MAERRTEQISPRWQRYLDLVTFLDKLPVDELIAHRIAWRDSKAKKVNYGQVGRQAVQETLERVLGWRGKLNYAEVPWPDDVQHQGSHPIPWEEVTIEAADPDQNTETQAVVDCTLHVILGWWLSKFGPMTLWEALALRYPGKNSNPDAEKNYNFVKKRLQRFRQQLVKNGVTMGSIK